jgi:hypothetical protein
MCESRHYRHNLKKIEIVFNWAKLRVTTKPRLLKNALVASQWIGKTQHDIITYLLQIVDGYPCRTKR